MAGQAGKASVLTTLGRMPHLRLQPQQADYTHSVTDLRESGNGTFGVDNTSFQLNQREQ